MCWRCSRRCRTGRRRRVRRSRARLGVDVRTVRRDVVSLRDLGIPVEAERGPGGCYRLRPGYRVPPLMFTAPEAAAAALGLVAARRLGLDADGALAKLRRVLPDRVRGQVEALEHALGFTGAARRPRRRTARRCSRSRTPPGARAASTRATRTRRRRQHARAEPVRRRLARRPLVRPGLRPHPRRAAHPARRPLRGRAPRRHGQPGPARLRADRLRQPLARARALDPRDRGAPAHAPGHRRPPLPTHPRRARARPPTHTLLRMRADSLDWAAACSPGRAAPSRSATPKPSATRCTSSPPRLRRGLTPLSSYARPRTAA